MIPKEPEWLLKEVILRFHDQQIREHGGIHGIRDESLFESAIMKPQQMWNFVKPYPSICDLAAAYAFGLIKNHAFLDGNKRTAAIACEVFLLLNKYEFTVGETGKYPNYLSLASGEHTMESFAHWLRANTTKCE